MTPNTLRSLRGGPAASSPKAHRRQVGGRSCSVPCSATYPRRATGSGSYPTVSFTRAVCQRCYRAKRHEVTAMCDERRKAARLSIKSPSLTPRTLYAAFVGHLSAVSLREMTRPQADSWAISRQNAVASGSGLSTGSSHVRPRSREIGKAATAQLPDQAIGRNEDSCGWTFAP